MSIIGDIGDPKKDAAAFAPVISAAEQDFITGLQTKIVPALAQAIRDAGAGLTVTITIKFSKEQS